MSSELVEKASELQELRLQYQRLQEAYRKILPKVDPNLIDDLLSRLHEDPDTNTRRSRHQTDVYNRGIYKRRNR
jgi:hypothetical protein